MNRLQSCIRPWGERCFGLGPSWNPRIESQSLEAAFKARIVIGLIRFGTDTFAMSIDRQATRGAGRFSDGWLMIASHADVIRIEHRTVMFHGPEPSRKFVGERHGGFVVTNTLLRCQRPGLQSRQWLVALFADTRSARGSTRTVDKQHAQITITASTDATQSPLRSGRMLALCEHGTRRSARDFRRKGRRPEAPTSPPRRLVPGHRGTIPRFSEHRVAI